MITDIEQARKNVDTDPTEAQKKAGNYKKGHIRVRGFSITIENPKGSYRKGTDPSGQEWKTMMHNDYGYFTKTVGKDGDAIDVFLGDNPETGKIFAIDQNCGGKFDETKVMLGFDNESDAKGAYLSNYQENWNGFSHITEVDEETFRKWLYDGHRQRKPFYQYDAIKKAKKKKPKKEVLQEMKARLRNAILEKLGA